VDRFERRTPRVWASGNAAFDKNPAEREKTGQRRFSMATADVQGKEETKLANGGGAFPFWFSVTMVVVVVAVLFGIFYGIMQLFS